jgi:S1-C subfamily serine protease
VKVRIRVYLGTIPDYAESDVKGVRLSGVAKDGPAAKAGLTGGDVVVELAGRKVENIYDYTYAIEALKIGQPAKIVVDRQGQRMTFEITPGSRE